MFIKWIFILISFLGAFSTFGRVGDMCSSDLALSVSQDHVTPKDYTIEIFPPAPYYVGDIISIRVTSSDQAKLANQDIVLYLEQDLDTPLATAQFSAFSGQAIFYWALDTSNKDPGFLKFYFTVPDIGDSWATGIHLLPKPAHRQAEWVLVHTTCCTVHYLTGTDAEADIDNIIAILEDRSAAAMAQFFPYEEQPHLTLDEPLPIVLIPIVVGHGGFATNEAVMTYSERNWAGIGLEILSHHEIVHVIDRQINTEGPRPSIFVEGIAVYLTGGHYREGDALLRGASLLEMGLYLPLGDIVNDFYAAQHEIGYMQAAALVAYLVEIWGWDTFIDFYFNLPEGLSDWAIINTALKDRFNTDFNTLEADFITFLKTFSPDESIKEDVHLTIEVYDTIRRYQTIAIPSAHFRTAWWPPISYMRDNGIVGDYAWREKAPFNIIIESLFLDIHIGFERGDYELIIYNSAMINRFLDIVEPTEVPLTHYAIGWPTPGVHRWFRQP